VDIYQCLAMDGKGASLALDMLLCMMYVETR